MEIFQITKLYALKYIDADHDSRDLKNELDNKFIQHGETPFGRLSSSKRKPDEQSNGIHNYLRYHD